MCGGHRNLLMVGVIIALKNVLHAFLPVQICIRVNLCSISWGYEFRIWPALSGNFFISVLPSMVGVLSTRHGSCWYPSWGSSSSVSYRSSSMWDPLLGCRFRTLAAGGYSMWVILSSMAWRRSCMMVRSWATSSGATGGGGDPFFIHFFKRGLQQTRQQLDKCSMKPSLNNNSKYMPRSIAMKSSILNIIIETDFYKKNFE